MIVCYCCSRSGLPAALQALEAGGMDDVLIKEVPCTASVEGAEAIREFRQGAQGVLFVGCLLENCAHHHGSEVAARRAISLERTVAEAGLGKGRVAMVHLAEHQSDRFRKAVEDMRAITKDAEGKA
ncbi:MAG: hydrogenase iron-sulfur subunit [Methanomassiliicoccales archaeon]|nr:hydrogenase iron-sulfur subunit [Methanomassiliicoccales archaeon]